MHLDDEPLDPYGLERAEIDAQLLDTCGISAEEGVVAGLDAREPLDDAPEREPFCAGYRQGYNIDDDLSEIERLVARYQARADQSDRLLAPPSIATAWRDRGIYYNEKARVHRDEWIGEVEIYDHVEFQAFEDEINFELVDDTVKEYLRINCGISRRR